MEPRRAGGRISAQGDDGAIGVIAGAQLEPKSMPAGSLITGARRGASADDRQRGSTLAAPAVTEKACREAV
jgi:hypothetical protein